MQFDTALFIGIIGGLVTIAKFLRDIVKDRQAVRVKSEERLDKMEADVKKLGDEVGSIKSDVSNIKADVLKTNESVMKNTLQLAEVNAQMKIQNDLISKLLKRFV